jgi:hypothetical protein
MYISSTELAETSYNPPSLSPLTGGKAILNCNIPNLPDNVNVYWKKDGRPFDTPNARIQFLNNNRKVEFSPLYREDAGSYTCSVDGGSPMTYSTGITVYDQGTYNGLVCATLYNCISFLNPTTKCNTVQIVCINSSIKRMA